MSERLDGRELLAIRARTARAHDGLHQSLARTEADREALLREVCRLDAERRALEAAIERVRALCTASPGADLWYVAPAAVLAALATPTPTEETDRG